MSESNQSHQSPNMNASAPPPQEGGSNGEFIVHTKHTCDVCFRRPIIGQRFASDVHANFDLCARCFEAYSFKPDIGLKEAVLIRDKKLSRDFVLKLKIIIGGDVQIRRVKVSEVWGESVSQLSFEKMMSLAASFALPEDKLDDAGVATFAVKAKATYIDEDGDEITMTSNDELDDAFLQILKMAKPFLITVTIPQDEAGKVSVVTAGKVKGMPKRIQVRKFEPSKKAFAVPMDKSPVGCKSANFFIHARHTCDGCQKTPIVGTRYHATKIPDFDLCATCFEKYEGDDLDFNPEIQERDRCMQQRWRNKGLCHASAPSNIAGIWDSTNGDLADFLKKVQESGASIESATVYHARPACKGFSVFEFPTKDSADSLKEVEESAEVEALASVPTIGRSLESPTSSNEEFFLSDADGSGSIAEAIGHTLDVCVAAIEAAIIEELEEVDSVEVRDNKARTQEPSKSKTTPNDNASLNEHVIASVATAADAFLVASSVVSSMTDILQRMDEAEKVEGVSQIAVPQSKDTFSSAASISSPSVNDNTLVEMPKVEDASDGEDEWSVVDEDDEKPKPNGTNIPSALSALSPVVTAKWDTELRQLHEMGFLDDRSNVDSLEHLEAAHMGVDSTEMVTVNAAVEHLVDRFA